MNHISAFQVAVRRFPSRSVLLGSMLACALRGGLVAQTAVFTGAQTTLLSTSSLLPVFMAIDGAGNIFLSDNASNSVVELPAGGGAPVTVASGLNAPRGVAVDANGDLFIAESGGGGSVIELPRTSAGFGAQVAVASELTSPEGVAVDSQGDVFIANNFGGWVLEVPYNAYGQNAETTLGSGMNAPKGMALDRYGDLFIADSGNNRIVELIFDGAKYSTPAVVVKGLDSPWGVAVDWQGDLFFSEAGKNRVVEMSGTPSGDFGAQTTVANGFNRPLGVLADSHGGLYVADYNGHRAVEFQRQSVNFGSVNVCPAGQTSPAPCRKTMALSFHLTPYPSSIAVATLTLGAYDLDFVFDPSGSACTGSAAAGETCIINVTFAPLLAGLRPGALQIFNGANGSLLASVPIYGIGDGPQVAFASSAQTVLGLSVFDPNGIAIDGAGSLFVADKSQNRVVEFPAGGGSPITIGSGLFYPFGLALDGTGDLFIADEGNNRVVKVPAGGGPQTSIGSGLNQPKGVAVDGAGDVFIADWGNSRVVEIAAGGGVPISIGSGLKYPEGVTVDGVGNIFIADTNNNRVVEVPAAGGQQVSLADGLVSSPVAVAVDGAGNLFIADAGNSRVVDLPAGSTQLYPVGSGLVLPNGVAVDSSGDVFIADTFNDRLVEVPRSQPPTLAFAATIVGATSADSPQTVSVQNIGNQPLVFAIPATGTNPSYPLNFPENIEDASLCASGGSLAPGGICDVSMSFEPLSGGSISASVMLTDNALNQKGAVQSIALSGTGVQMTPTIKWPAPAPIPAGTPLGGAQLDAIASVAGKLVYTPAAGTVLAVGPHTLSVAFTPANTAAYTTASASVTLWVTSVVKIQPTITWKVPAAIQYGTALGAAQLDATASVPGKFVYNPAAGTVLGAGTHTLKATFTPADAANYATATTTVTLKVNPGLLTVAATNVSVAAGKPLPALTYTVAGFVHGDKSTVLSGKPIETTTAKQGSPAGTYPIVITQGTLKAANYTFKFKNGTLTITSAGSTASPMPRPRQAPSPDRNP